MDPPEHAVSPESIINGLKRSCISKALDGREDDVLWEEPEEPEHGSDDSEREHSEAEDLCEECNVLTGCI